MRHPPSIYKPLSDTFKSLRLIEVLPLSSDGLIYIRMREARTPGRYQCLSYMWGDASEETEAKVIVNGQPKYVRRNLYTFLQTAQQRFTEQPLWVDALCINQDDDVEKSHQVQRMGHIYRFAESVIIWLGVEVELTPLFEFVNFLWYAYGVADGNRTIVLAFPEYPIETRRERIINSAFQRLCSNPYWSRTWVAQEVLLAQRIIIVNAEEEMGFESLNQVLLPSVDDSGKERSMLKKFANSRRQHQGKGQFQNMQAVIWDLLEWLGDSHCGDERDHIYGLLSLVKGGRSFTVDYGEDVCSLFWRAGEHFRAWTKQKSMHLLCRTLGLTIERLQENLTSTVKLKPSLIAPSEKL
ncbi:HET-domain-containing protein [Lentithecium fluviatile CBS 122367]|uniref:HET-domain-containing protein n=1 Tax=Lentithecium fluviatile CBS 122367 TaxID=1168545 RepID=A0A6G1J883_9PLEO|nr:HET-domain-containing protein [Lentithecium fluviatile CBS 122367]